MRAAFCILVLVAGCSAPPPSVEPTALGDRPGVHNVFRVSDSVFTGSQPEGAAGFDTVRKLGVTTVISVDGAAPDVAAASAAGLKYVHLPIGYDAVPAERTKEIAAAVRAADGTVFVHCHHGKHRGPAAAAAAVRCLDPRFTAEKAEAYLKAAGTDPKYAGLYRSVAAAAKLSDAELAALPSQFPAVNAVADSAKLMVKVDEVWDRLKAAKAAGWDAGDQAHDAVLLREHFRELARLPGHTGRPAEFRSFMAQSEARADELGQLLAKKPDGWKARVDAAFAEGGKLCSQCHGQFRDK